jgi:hypothetical protein
MDSWGQPGLNPKCELHRLPTTINEFLTRNKHNNDNIATMRMLTTAAHDFPTIHATNAKLNVDKHEPRKSMDIYCDACGSHGHPWKHCDFLAKMIKAQQFLQ